MYALTWLGQSQTVNFEQGSVYVIQYAYTGVQCSTIDLPQAVIVVNSLGFTALGPAEVSQSGPNSCTVRVRARRSEPTTLIDVGPTGPFSALPNSRLESVRSESGSVLFQAPQPTPAPAPTPTPVPAPTPTPIEESRRKASFWNVATVAIIAGAVGLALVIDQSR